MATIKAPFNFVPLSDKIFFPEWADQISQDIPFSDGLSGTIELKITAETPSSFAMGILKKMRRQRMIPINRSARHRMANISFRGHPLKELFGMYWRL